MNLQFSILCVCLFLLFCRSMSHKSMPRKPFILRCAFDYSSVLSCISSTGITSESVNLSFFSLTVYCLVFSLQECTACCEGNICNMSLPRNETDAIFVTTSPINESMQPAQSPTLLLSVCIVGLMLHSIN